MSFNKRDWLLGKNTVAFSTLRSKGASVAPYDCFNLALHVDDCPVQVLANRHLLNATLPNPAHFVNQIHSNKVVKITEYETARNLIDADALYTNLPNCPLAIMTADCLPLLVRSNNSHEVAAIHAGWRGLLNGVIENTLACFESPLVDLVVQLAPAISQQNFEVGSEVKAQFVALNPLFESAFVASQKDGKFMADLYQLARLQLEQLGVKQIQTTSECTFKNAKDYYSYRRDGQTGRNAHIIYSLI